MYNKGNRDFRGRDSFRGNRPGFRGRPQQQQHRRPPLPEGFSLYYVALICPDEVNEQVKAFKHIMFEKYGCKAAAKSPAHITVVPPFRAEDDLEQTLLDFVSAFSIGIVPFEAEMGGYNNFGDRVLFIDVKADERLLQLEKDCMDEFTMQFPSIIFGMKPQFSPHVTIATRDIPEGKLPEAKSYFESNHPFQAGFPVKEIRLVKLEHGDWKVL